MRKDITVAMPENSVLYSIGLCRLLERSAEVLALYSIFHSLLLHGGLLNNRRLSFMTR